MDPVTPTAALNSEIAAPDRLDLRGTPCPLNFVRAKMRLQQLDPGSVLELWLDPGEPMEQVPNSLTMAGYGIEAIADWGEHFQVLVRCPPESASPHNAS